MRIRQLCLRLLVLLSGLIAGETRAADNPASPPMTLLPASDPRFLYEGRFDTAKPAQPVVIWAGSRVSLDFAGDRLAVVFGAAKDQNFFNLTVDGVTEVVGVTAGRGFRFAWPRELGAGRHRLELFKRTEADAGHAAFLGVELAAGAEAWAPAAPAYRFRLQFIGDSITAGANSEDGAVDQWDDRRTHNHAVSYGVLTAQALGADLRAVAVSGMGVVEGFVPMHAGETWDRVYPRPPSARADFAAWRPDVVCINLGENDEAFTRTSHRPFPASFTADYVALVHAVRAAWPRAHLVLLRGGMFGGAKSPYLRAAWSEAVKQLEAGDPTVSHYVFKHWSEKHPRVSDHQAMAGELTEWLKQQSFMKPYL